MQPQKKSWKLPELVVLVRSKPEEAVLLACKGGATNGAGSVEGICRSAFGVCSLNCLANAAS